MEKPLSSAGATRQSLIEAGLRLFGAKGYDAVSTREIADHAAANIGSIAYHFGGKPGLRLACAQFVMEQIGDLVAPALAKPQLPVKPGEAEAIMEAALSSFGRFIISSPQAAVYASFIIREVMQPGEVVDLIYETLFGPVHKRFCVLFAAATGQEAESEEVRLAVFAFFGQILYFRIARPIVLKRMEWNDISAAEAELMVSTLQKNLKGLIAAYRKG